ncbi:DMT family transporter [Cognatishimia maritima]|uniref:EamA-like transporter family protein n=1 Tax=Cognatishimia maritima TaxID=870908 RepID=A0A1M5TY49_9RHOB|nr:DMT family transporter [Cognatishimia maritima]SHH55712.1 EamA-like transporter family protein [Cognatishimia maritima]
MQQDRTLLGIALMLGFSALAPIGDAVVKLLGDLVPVAFFVLWRFALQALFLTPIVLATGASKNITLRQHGLILLRTLCHIVGVGSIFIAFRYLPLADAIAIAFVMPFFSLLLGKYVLGEEVGLRRLLACCVGFVGTLLVIQPSFVEVGAPALWPVLTAVAFAVFMLVGRQIAQQADPIAIQMISGYMATVLVLPLIVIGSHLGIPELGFIIPSGATLWMLILAGAIGTVAHLLMTWSLRFAPSATLAPLTYVEIPITTLVGFIVFGDLPNALAATGIGLSVAAGLYIIFREQATARASAKVPLPHSPTQP